MRIAYGVMGYGRGHAMRTSAVLPGLMQRHDVKVFAGADAYPALHERFPCETLPVIGYQYDDQGRLSAPLTMARNAGLTADLLAAGPQTRAVWQRLAAFAPDLVISDSETWTHRFARHHGIPRISFDHVGIMAFCHCDFAPEDRWRGMRDALGYRLFMGDPDRVLVSSFYPARPRTAGVEVVGPILRDAVRNIRPERGDYLLAYLNKGEHQYTTALDTALRACGEQVIVYGVPRRGQEGNLHFKPPANEGFVADLAGCKGVISTAGNQLLSEAVFLGKPVLTMPEDVVEQRLNARAVVNMGVGAQTSLTGPSLNDIGRFLERLDHYAAHTTPHRRDGLPEAEAALGRFIRALRAGRPQPTLLSRVTGAY
ncbi:glycosyltransferase family protein [Salinisphaera sp. P385]|uniref:Glycosyltransferase family protein n=1 Tax=Spectribacter acetivorans TaxID=3075603 RepID=A0ABU3BC66_9GAMM|nr:glycosyltransferase family protein [Salinisphaera sp. P385]MDT0619595.1 glycosyltransferase family protein [Salinisphaera sp. P385]